MVIDKQDSMNFGADVVRRGLADERGATFAEFGLVFVLIAVIVLVLAVASGGGTLDFFQQG